ncbi:hypothetical protein AX15_004566 [Amanita polypyramis BW_CC]|nr:hypothetical protein AX15_004566 [Amanita polypyramis BW_CC]
MNNLLRTLTESQAKSAFPDVDLRLLLSTVKEGRRQSQDAKLSDPFYDSLEGLLQDLRTITPDNRDPEAFLKPVSRADVPDYHDVISNPMDLQTMLKKVKQKQYKSKREFQDDLDLIWSNCFMYNAAESHPLRQCARRLKAKAESLLKNITDRKERTDPVIPPELGHSQVPASPMSVRIRLNGSASSAHIVNGAINGHSRRLQFHSTSANGISYTQSNPSCPSPPVAVAKRHHPGSQSSPTPSLMRTATVPARQDIPFSETPALVRTQEGMALFDTIDKELERIMNGPVTEKSKAELMDKLIDLAPPYDYCEGVEEESSHSVVKTEPDENLGVEVGEKRKSIDSLQASQRPRKRARFSLSSGPSAGFRQPAALPLPLSFTSTNPHDKEESVELMELWWGAVQSDALLANGLPRIQVSSSKQSARIAARSDASTPLANSPSFSSAMKSKPQRKAKIEPNRIESGPSSLLSMINTNLKTMKRVRHTHSRFASLLANTAVLSGADESVDGLPPTGAVDGYPSQAGGISGHNNIGATDEENVDVVEDRVDERPWLQHYIDAAQFREDVVQPIDASGGVAGLGQVPAPKVKKKGKRRRQSRLPTGVDMGEEIANNCARWMGEKVLEHVGFQGSSKVALDVLAGVTKEYLYNVGRTIKFLTDKYAQTMTAEEIILHTLFESGASKVQDLERYITDDIKRHGTRLNDLERKLVNAYRDSTSHEVVEDEGLFEEEEEDETGALAVGDFADVLGEDYLGLRELGIAAEFGMSSLTIPKKLLRGKKPQKASGAASKPKELPPPYPPPPPFLPLTYGKLDEQIGLLKSFYQARFAARASALSQDTDTKPVIPPLPGPSGPQRPETPAQDAPQTPQAGSLGALTAQPPETSVPPDFVLPDDPPNPLQVKIGPLGQIIRPSTTTGSGKKKGKGAISTPAQGQAGQGQGQSGNGTTGQPGSVGGPDTPGSVESSPKKKKSGTGVGIGSGRKKKVDGQGGEMTQSPAPPSVAFGHGQSQSQNRDRAGQGKGVVFPTVVVASA